MASNGLEQQQTLNNGSSPSKHSSWRELRRSPPRSPPRSPNKRRVRLGDDSSKNGSPDKGSISGKLDFVSLDEKSLSEQLNLGSSPKRGSPSKRSPNKRGSPCKRSPNKRGSPSGSPKKRLSPSKKHHTPYLGGGSFTPMVEKRKDDNGKTVKKVVFVYHLEGIKPIDKRRFELANPTIRPISYKDWLKIKESHERTDVPNVVQTFPITEIPDNGVLKCEICMERVRTLFEVLPTITSEERQQLSRKLWKTLSEINTYLSKEGLCLNDPALNWGLDEEGNIRFFDLLFSKKMTIASAFKFFYDGQVPLSPEDEKKIVQLRAFGMMVLFVENFEETSCRLDFENLVRKLYVENNVSDMSIAELESFLSSRL